MLNKERDQMHALGKKLYLGGISIYPTRENKFGHILFAPTGEGFQPRKISNGVVGNEDSIFLLV